MQGGKGMRTGFFASSPSHSSYASSPMRRSPSPSPSPARKFSETIMEDNIRAAEAVVRKWSVEGSSSGRYSGNDSLFGGDRREAKDFLRSVKDLQTTMQFYVAEDSTSENLVQAQCLMQIAMRRLEKEFYQILSRNRECLDPESVSSRSSRASGRSSVSEFEGDMSEDDDQAAGGSVSEVESPSVLAMADLTEIANTMISSGYGKECVKIYKIIRRSIVDESLYYLGVEKLSLSQIQKMDWDAIELRIKSWLNAVKVAVKTLFLGERTLCDHVFSTGGRMAESCFAEIASEGAMTLFGFPELVAKYKKLSPEKMFRILDLYEAISDLWPEIESIFSLESVSAVRSQAIASLLKLGDAVRAMLSDFEMAIQKDTSKSPVPGGGFHPLTRYVMNYVVFLSDYSWILSDIVADWPLSVESPVLESYFSSPVSDDSPTTAISMRLAWLILVLLCKLDGKAKLYKDVPLSYLFLMNNLNYVISKVRTSNLVLLLGDDWLAKHEEKVKQYASNYERMAWNKVISSLPNSTDDISPEAARKCFGQFNSAFDEAYRKQTSWVVPDPKLRDEIKISLAKLIGPAYKSFYEKYQGMLRWEIGSSVRYVPDDLGNYLSDLFYGTLHSGNLSSSSSLSSSPLRTHRG
ncbi:exocyst complex component EXO70H1 [Diospyros lotus]|uniref:exocyst complex component EXO70H1 n=1 Tax=Diospyros lotus TaxID=55363 RepID=UPI0022557349|nr:exocyst complex component EXO70H1 [Diospyros lotus]